MRGIAASVLVFEALVLVFATLVAKDLSDVDNTTIWTVGLGGALLCVLVAGLLRYQWAYFAGSILQILLIGAGVVVPVMFFLGAIFAGLWFLALYLGRRVEGLGARRGP